MALVNQPSILPSAFAAEGDKNTIPANNDGLSGLASVAKGFPPITQVPLAQGGLPPQRQDFNGIFNLFSQFLLYAQNGGVYAYNNTLDYQPPAIIASDNVFYQCVAENGPSTSAGVQPVTNTDYWQKLVPDIVDNRLQRNTAYQYGDIAYSNNLPSWAYLFCVQAGTTAASEPSFASVNTMGQYITDGTVKWIVDDVRFNIPAGVPFYDTYLHDGCVKLNGATVNRADYPRLVALANANNLWTSNPANEPWKFGQGNGSTTMVLPNYIGRFIQGGDNTAKLEAGLPNITGVAPNALWANINPNFYNGALSFTGSTLGSFNSGDAHIYSMTFNASLCSNIYGRSNTVQPPSIILIPQLRY